MASPRQQPQTTQPVSPKWISNNNLGAAGVQRNFQQTGRFNSTQFNAVYPDTLTRLSELASVLVDPDNHLAKEYVSRWALEESERVLGKEHPDTFTRVSDLASVSARRRKS